MAVLLVFAVFVCSAYGYSMRHWINTANREANFKCGKGQVISRIASYYDATAKDRLWDISCHDVRATKQCTNYAYRNWFHEDLTFECPNKGAIVGMDSLPNSNYHDRKFKFTCCFVPIMIVNKCWTTDYISDFHSDMNVKLDFDEVFAGIYSKNDKEKSDRIWKMKVCKLHVYG